MMVSTSILTVRIDESVRQRLEKLASATDRSKSYVAAQAINDYLDLHEWQVAQIHAGIAEAEEGQLVSHEKIMQEWEKKRANLLDKRRKKKSSRS